MKKPSKHQALFAILSVVLTTVFLLTLNYFIANKEWKNINIIAIAFGILMFVNGLANGYFDNHRMYNYDLGFRYHLITYFAVNVVHIVYVLIASSHFTFKNAALGAIFWGIGLLVHSLYVKKTIKGYTPEELFD